MNDGPRPPVQSDTDESVRVRLSACASTTPDIMLTLAADPSPVVRATLAMNRSTPPEVDRALALDSDERVRILLARKLAASVPACPQTQARLPEQALTMLTALAADQAVRVRAAIAEEVKDLPDASRALVLRLAQDESIMVCEPVIRFSPLLSPEDLVCLLGSAPSPATAQAVARRAEIDETVSDAVAATADSEAIRLLLANRSAHIREATLDALIQRATDHKAWHEPLVHRPVLPPHAARKLADIVATHLLEVLARRSDFDRSLTQHLLDRVTARLAKEPPERPAQGYLGLGAAVVEAQRRADQGELSETSLLEAARLGDLSLTTAMLALAAKVPVSMVERAASLRSAKGFTSLTWRAGFTMRASIVLQGLLARLPPAMVLQPGPDNSFPLSLDEMRWQLDFLARAVR